MVTIHDFSAWRARRSRVTKGFALAAMLAAAAAIVATASLVSFGDHSAAPPGHASAATRIHALSAAPNAARADSTTTNADQPRGFDYFPDHYRNKAVEPAEPVDTF